MSYPMKKIDPLKNYLSTRNAIGYVDRKNATQKDYNRIGFMSGLEVHQQLLTKEKLFCRCPAGIFQKHHEYDAELIRHMRPTLSELGEYDGTALMEFKTRKEIVYRIKNETACTYDVDDTPPFPINREALEIALKISLLSRLNIVGEVHITRKQYLDGSIPTGFQRTAILGVEGEIPLKKKKVRLIQLSIEEDSCREISDIGHRRIYKTDRLGMPLIETVTYPDMENPDEVKEACDYIRFLNRSTGLVRTGMGAGREDVNVSCKGGTRVEIKGVAHTRWIPELTHREAFRQWALLAIRKELNARISKADWKMNAIEIHYYLFQTPTKEIDFANEHNDQIWAVNLPKFAGILSHFTQEGQVFAHEISDRLKVIACIEKPNMTHSECLESGISEIDFEKIRKILKANGEDALLVFWGNSDDIKTALETIEERCLMAFDGVPPETRKSFEEGSTIFERVLPGADRMYPDTDSAPIPLANKYIESLWADLPTDIIERYNRLKEWGVSEDTYHFLFTNNLFPLILEINEKLKIDPKLMGNFLGHRLKFIEGHAKRASNFEYKIIYGLFKYLQDSKLDFKLADEMLKLLIEHPKMQFDSVLTSIKFKKVKRSQLLDQVQFLTEKFKQIGKKQNPVNAENWIMGQLRKLAIGNMTLTDLHQEVRKVCDASFQ
jgi:glutamyl-tRNA(Gln) amidotransferase subunit E